MALMISVIVAIILTTSVTSLKAPLTPCSCMCKYFFRYSSSNYLFLASTISQMGNVSINVPCNDEYCTFHKGMNTSLTFTFNLRKLIEKHQQTEKLLFFRFKERKIHKVRAKVLATIGSFDHNFALPNSNVCQQLKCPHQKSIPYTYHNSMYVSPSYPSVCTINSFS